MRVFADTNFFTNVWLALSFRVEAETLLSGLANVHEHLPVTRLIRMEFANAVQRLVFESRPGRQGLRVTPEAALVAQGAFEDELNSGDFLRWQSLPEEGLEVAFDTLVHRHTAKHGFRTYDIIHVAAALMLGCEVFWTFDERAKKLARLEGLETN